MTFWAKKSTPVFFVSDKSLLKNFPFFLAISSRFCILTTGITIEKGIGKNVILNQRSFECSGSHILRQIGYFSERPPVYTLIIQKKLRLIRYIIRHALSFYDHICDEFQLIDVSNVYSLPKMLTFHHNFRKQKKIKRCQLE